MRQMMILTSGGYLVFLDIDKDHMLNLASPDRFSTLIREREELIRIFESEVKAGDLVPLSTAGGDVMLVWSSRWVPGYDLAALGVFGDKKDMLNAYRQIISTFLDEADAGGTPSYDSLRAVLKQYK